MKGGIKEAPITATSDTVCEAGLVAITNLSNRVKELRDLELKKKRTE
mgnify:CR=1 FL=1